MPIRTYDIVQPRTFGELHRETTRQNIGQAGVLLVAIERAPSELDERRRMKRLADGDAREKLYLRPILLDFIGTSIVGWIARAADGARADIGTGRVMKRSHDPEAPVADGELMLIVSED